MIVTIKSKDGYKVDVSRLYFQALAKEITVEEYKNELDYITSHNKLFEYWKQLKPYRNNTEVI